MASRVQPGDVLFLDTSYAVALSSPSDKHHLRARELAAEVETAQATFLTTRAVVLEIGNSLSRKRYRTAAVELLESIEADDTIDVLPITDELYAEALQLFVARTDKEWGLIDCCSFIVMTKHKLTKALTADHHFVQAGFEALLLED